MRFFEELRVVDLTAVWVGPIVTRVLADLGAEVIKIEAPGRPDRARTTFVAENDTSGEYWNNRSHYWAVRNAGKKSLILDLAGDEGRSVLFRLLEDADVFIENFTPGVVARLGVGYEDLKERFPRLIVMSLSGYGQTGPDRTRPAYGMTMEVASGPASVTGYRDGGVSKTGQTWVDGYAGLHGAAALVAALIYRERSGRGQYIDVSMQEATAPMLDWHLADYLLNGRLHGGDGNRRRGAVRGVYPSAGNDDWVAISIGNEPQWEAFCEAAGRLDWLADERFADSLARGANHDELDGLIAAWTRQRTKFEATATLQAAGVPAGPVLHADEVFRDPQLSAREFFDALELTGFRAVPVQRAFTPKFDGRGFGAGDRAPLLGEHTEEILRSIGIDDAEIAQLHEAGTIAADPGSYQLDLHRESLKMPLDDYLEMGVLLRIDEDFQLI